MHQVIESISVPSVEKLELISVTNIEAKHAVPAQFAEIEKYISALPLPCQFVQCASDFYHLIVALDTRNVPTDLLPYIEFLLELIFESPILRGGGK